MVMIKISKNSQAEFSLNPEQERLLEKISADFVADEIINADDDGNLKGSGMFKADYDSFVTATNTALANKVNTEAGKGLSSNDYTTAEKTAVGTIGDKVDKVEGKQLSTQDYSRAEKAKVALLANAYTADQIVIANALGQLISSGKTLAQITTDITTAIDAALIVAGTDATTKVNALKDSLHIYELEL